MPSRKRQASSSLQPAHHVKQPRLQLTRADGTPTSPTESIVNRWCKVGKDIFHLGVDTLAYAFTMPFSSSPSIEPESPVQEYPSSSSSSPSPIPNNAQDIPINSSTPVSRRIRSKDPPKRSISQEKHTADNISLQLESLAFTPPSSRRPPSQSSDAAFATSSTPLPSSSQPVSQQSSITNFSFASAESSQTTASSPTTQQADPLSSEYGQRKRGFTPRPDPHSRPHHIHHKRHKAAVKAEKKKLRDELVKKIHAVKVEQGFVSSEKDLSGLLSYERLIRNIKVGQRFARMLGPFAPSADDLKVPFAAAEAKRLLDEEEEEQFLHRALERAKSTLNSPRPVKPYIPAYEELEVRRRKKDKDLESRLAVPSIPSTLPPDDEQKVKSLLQKRGVISKFAREQVSDTDLRRLGPGQWLNDELINFYGALILDRAEFLCKEVKEKGGKALDVHYFSTFFWAKLVNDGYEKGRMAKWTKKIDIFAKDLILIPVNHNNTHWTAAAINFRQKRLESYDTMAYLDQGVFEMLRIYLEAESMNKKKKSFDWDGWTNWAPKTTPQQENGFDCGVFTCQILRAVARGDQAFAFSQKDMPYLRRRMIWEIGHAKLRDGYS